ncbi:hypothetical protein H4S02_013517, partial [Coemansia sp. RSA 2611]
SPVPAVPAVALAPPPAAPVAGPADSDEQGPGRPDQPLLDLAACPAAEAAAARPPGQRLCPAATSRCAVVAAPHGPWRRCAAGRWAETRRAPAQPVPGHEQLADV